MERKELILVIEKRVTVLIAEMERYDGIGQDGLPDHRYSIAFAEWNILRDASRELQSI